MKIDQYIKILSKCDLFTNIDKDELLKIFDSINYRIIKYAKNTIIHKKNDSCKDLIIILNGTLSLYEDNFNNKTFTVYSFSPVSIVGANTLFSDNNHYKLNIICKTNCTLLYISRDVIFNLFTFLRIFLFLYCFVFTFFFRFCLVLSKKTTKPAGGRGNATVGAILDPGMHPS